MGSSKPKIQGSQSSVDRDVASRADSKANDQSEEGTTSSNKSNTGVEEGSKTPVTPQRSRARDSWYGATWRTKSTPVTGTAKNSISVEQGVTSESLKKVQKATESTKRPGQNVPQSMRSSSKSIPLVAEPTKVHATSEARTKSRTRHDSEEKLRAVDIGKETQRSTIESSPAPKESPVGLNDDAKSMASSIRPQSTMWLGGWWSRPDGYASDSEKAQEGSKRRKLDDSSTAPYVPTPQRELERSPLDQVVTSDQQDEDNLDSPLPHRPANSQNNTTRSWFGTWSTNQNQQQEASKEMIKPSGDEEVMKNDTKNVATPAKQTSDKTEALGDAQDSSVSKAETQDGTRPSGWAFWSHDRPKEAVTTPNGTQKQLGEIAVADTPSQSHPEAAQFNEQKQKAKVKSKSKTAKSSSSKKTTKQDVDEKFDEVAEEAAQSETKDSKEVAVASRAEVKVAEVKKSKKTVPNVVAPAFAGMYPAASNAGYVERLAKYLAQTLYIPGSSTPSNRHIMHKTTGLPKIKKTIAIGVHGFFPAPLLQRVLGPPTGTSIRFANYAAAAIAEWCKHNQPEIKEIEIEKVALEGEGFIADRVNTLWKLLLNWLTHLRQADFIMVACHSQGVPVGIMLIAKLIQLGVLSPHAKIGICAMAGINLGPFLEYRSRLFAGSALELFDFCDSSSKVSKSYFESVDVCLRHGVRITYVGSLDDQLVSLESSLFMPLQHPYVHRATFIDGRLHSPSFLTHLVIFALKLRNLGISDHGLLRELSAPLAGSLVGGEGHSRIYDDPQVYRTAIDFALESTDIDPSFYDTSKTTSGDKEKAKEAAFQRRSSVSGFPASTAAANSMRRGSMSALSGLSGIGAVITSYEPLVTGANSNPFYLPWAVRGMLEEDAVKRNMQEEVGQLVQEFDDWKPQSKVLKDVKWRLEGVKSML